MDSDSTLQNILLDLKDRSAPSPDLKDMISMILSVLVMEKNETILISNPQEFLKSRLDQSFGPSQSDRIFNKFNPIYAPALAKANIFDTTNTVHAEQFCIFLRVLSVYAIMIDSFRKLCDDANYIDEQAAGIGREEFLSRYERILGYGLAGCDNIRGKDEAGEVFDIINIDDGITIGLAQWISYLSRAEVRLKTHFGVILQEEYVVPQETLSAQMKTNGTKVVTIDSSLLNSTTRLRGSVENSSTKSDVVERASQMQSGLSVSPQIQVNFTIGSTSSRTLKNFVSALEAYTVKAAQGQKLRIQGFKIADQSGTGRCTLEELEGFIKHALGIKFQPDKSADLYRIYQPSFVKAFATTKTLGSSQNSDSISITSFRLFNVCLLIYAAIYDSFRLAKIDGGLNEENDEMHLDKTTFVRRYKKIKGSGFVGLDNIMDDDAANSIFDLMRTTADDAVSFSEWVDYIEKAEIRMNTELGQYLSQKQSSAPSDQSVVVTVTTKMNTQQLSRTPNLKPLEIPSIGTIGLAATSNLRDFVETFKPYTEKTLEGQKLRIKEFKQVNSDGSGRCSLADLETFIKRLLSTRFESSRTYYLFDLFRPSFARAYVKAQAFNYAKDNVSITEFRVFSVYTCIYASMFDAFSKVEENDLIKADDFEARFGRLHGYDFAALARIQEKDQARDLFSAMDKAARGYVDFDDFCYCLEKIEILKKTKLGEFLGINLVCGSPRSS